MLIVVRWFGIGVNRQVVSPNHLISRASDWPMEITVEMSFKLAALFSLDFPAAS
jgi:hypothetical protein